VLCSCRGLGGQINTRFFQSDLTPTNTTKLCLALLSRHPSTILPGIQSYPYPGQGPRSASAGIDIGRPAPVQCSTLKCSAVPLFVPSTKPRAGAGHCFLSSVSVSVATVTIVASHLFLYAPSLLTLSTLATKSHLVLLSPDDWSSRIICIRATLTIILGPRLEPLIDRRQRQPTVLTS
jgi:hypothetical protein